MRRRSKDFAGTRVGKLTALSVIRVGKAPWDATWLCLCECGNYAERKYESLRCEKTQSCGCGRQDLATKKKTSWRQQFNIYQRSAVRRNLDFTLTFDQFCDITAKVCYYCGDAPTDIHKSRKQWHVSNGIDRVDNTKGYTLDNCVPCCKLCNFMKHSQAREDFIARCIRIAETFSSKTALAP